MGLYAQQAGVSEKNADGILVHRTGEVCGRNEAVYSGLGQTKSKGNIRLADDKDDRHRNPVRILDTCFCIFLPWSAKEEELFEILESMEQQFLYLYQSYVPKYRRALGCFTDDFHSAECGMVWRMFLSGRDETDRRVGKG